MIGGVVPRRETPVHRRPPPRTFMDIKPTDPESRQYPPPTPPPLRHRGGRERGWHYLQSYRWQKGVESRRILPCFAHRPRYAGTAGSPLYGPGWGVRPPDWGEIRAYLTRTHLAGHHSIGRKTGSRGERYYRIHAHPERYMSIRSISTPYPSPSPAPGGPGEGMTLPAIIPTARER